MSLQRVQLLPIGIAALSIAAMPAAWNVVARNEYRHKTIQKLVRCRHLGVYLLAAAIFAGSGLRDWTVYRAMRQNAALELLPRTLLSAKAQRVLPAALNALGASCIAAGTTLVLGSFAKLGLVGTYLGDYFGLTLPARVTSFPFNLLDNPMYVGSTLNFLGAALGENSAVGTALTAWVALVYYVATTYFEQPFMEKIYAEKEAAAATTAAAHDATC